MAKSRMSSSLLVGNHHNDEESIDSSVGEEESSVGDETNSADEHSTLSNEEASSNSPSDDDDDDDDEGSDVSDDDMLSSEEEDDSESEYDESAGSFENDDDDDCLEEIIDTDRRTQLAELKPARLDKSIESEDLSDDDEEDEQEEESHKTIVDTTNVPAALDKDPPFSLQHATTNTERANDLDDSSAIDDDIIVEAEVVYDSKSGRGRLAVSRTIVDDDDETESEDELYDTLNDTTTDLSPDEEDNKNNNDVLETNEKEVSRNNNEPTHGTVPWSPVVDDTIQSAVETDKTATSVCSTISSLPLLNKDAETPQEIRSKDPPSPQANTMPPGHAPAQSAEKLVSTLISLLSSPTEQQPSPRLSSEPEDATEDDSPSQKVSVCDGDTKEQDDVPNAIQDHCEETDGSPPKDNVSLSSHNRKTASPPKTGADQPTPSVKVDSPLSSPGQPSPASTSFERDDVMDGGIPKQVSFNANDKVMEPISPHPTKHVTLDDLDSRGDVNSVSALCESVEHLTMDTVGKENLTHQLKSAKSSGPLKPSQSKVEAKDRARPKIRREGSVKQGKWKLGSKIGSGAFGVVHVGMNTQTGTLMAVKSVRMEGSIMKDAKSEIQLLKSLKHHNIVQYYGAEMDQKYLHIFQEWVPAGSLSGMLHKFGVFPLTVLRIYLEQILEGLAYLHERNIMHRDIKGSNILVNDDGVVKLADFGASKQFAQLKGDMSLSLTMRGTPYYMAPEVFKEKYSSKADIWSVGCVAFQMATGTPPWKSLGFTNPVSLYHHISEANGPPAMEMNEAESITGILDGRLRLDQFKDVVAQCFRTIPVDRPSARDLLDDPLFTNDSSWTLDDQCEYRGLFSPATTVCDSPGPKTSPFGALSPIRPTLGRRNSFGSARSPFMSPPLPRSGKKSRTPQPDASEWPTWARERLRVEEGMKGRQSQSPRPIKKLNMSLDSLAFSMNSDDGSPSEPQIASDTGTHLAGLALMNTTGANSKEEKRNL